MEHVKAGDGEAAWIRGVPCYERKADHNGYASAAMVLRHWDAVPKRSDINALRASRFDQQAVLTNIAAWVRDSGLWIHMTSGSEEHLREQIRHGAPTIVYLQDSALDITSLRVAVVVGYDNIDAMWLCHDGAPTPTLYSYEHFSQQWLNAFNGMLTLCPIDFPTWSLRAEERLSRARFYAMREQYMRAIDELELALVDLPLDDDLHLQLGYLYHVEEQPERAEALYRRALEINEHNPSAYNNLAFLLAEENRSLDEALELAKQATYLDPSSPHAMDTLGYTHFRMGSYDEAERALERARGLAKELPLVEQKEIALHLAWSYASSGQPHLARQILSAIATRQEDFEIPAELMKALTAAENK